METLVEMARAIKVSKYLVAFTGAGISAESGIATYRGEKGLWNKYDPNIYANISYFKQDPSFYWSFFREVRFPNLKKARPNPGHFALAELETLASLKAVITQNIDGLHQEAGSSRVIELHGTARVIYCMNCSRQHSLEEVFSMLETSNIPHCVACEGKLRPAVVFFGEDLDPQILHSAYKETLNSDFFLVVGSSLVVYPAADLPLQAKRNGAKLAIVNKERTPFDQEADFVLSGEAGKILPRMVEVLKKL